MALCKSFIVPPRKSDFSETGKWLSLGALNKRFFGNIKKLFFRGALKSDFSETEKIDFSWLSEKEIIRKPKKRLFRAY